MDGKTLHMKPLNNHLGKLPVFKIQSMGSDDKEKVVHRNLLLPLFPDPSDQISEQDNKSLIDPKETMSTQVAIVVMQLPIMCIT